MYMYLQMIYAYMGWKRISKFQTFTVKVVHLLLFCKRNQKHAIRIRKFFNEIKQNLLVSCCGNAGKGI